MMNLNKTNKFRKTFIFNGDFNRNRTLFYKLLSDHLVEFMPIIYDPVVAESIENIMRYFQDLKKLSYL